MALDAPVAHAEWSLGADTGIGLFYPDNEKRITSLAVGSGPGGLLFQPGFRFTTKGRSHQEVALSVGVSSVAGGSSSFHSIQAMLSWQINLGSGYMIRPFVAPGAGVVSAGVDGNDETVPVFGLGIGLRRWMSHRHGAARYELHVARQLERQGEFGPTVPGITSVELRAGFELWN